MNYCGIDLSNKSSAFCVMESDGKILFEGEGPTDEDSFRNVLKRFPKMRCIVEASPLAEWAACTLEELGHEAVVIDPRRAKAVICTKNKTDKLDARNLARMARTGWFTKVHRKSCAARHLRTLLQARSGMVKSSQEHQSRVRGLLRSHGIRVGPVAEGEFSIRVHEIIAAKAPELGSILDSAMEANEHALRSARELKKKIEEVGKRDPLHRRLTSVPGVGVLTASAFVATIDNPNRFKSGNQLAAYLGLVPRVYQSGESEYRGRITKEGDRMLRALLVEAAHVLLTRTLRSCPLKRWGQKILKKKGHGKAKVAVARKLAILLHRLWFSGDIFVRAPA